ncbi:hypothetical protein BDA99DRAFT_561371 [Phascolomyces articulosus]|uniref:Uncharacterized protein n=1 Tax=Phascolomyces articulosus TaxID=60185 RepID=A0AAD5PD04_9FUNG|nr:hypothetical protein BDA99DRAFT_561371 [Phascolomyces articulosus]
MTDGTDLSVYQNSGQAYFARNSKRRFHHDRIPPNSEECCPYTSRDCSRSRDPNDDSCTFDISYSRNEGKEKGRLTYPTFCPCGGYIIANGSYDHFEYSVYDANHRFLGGRGPAS